MYLEWLSGGRRNLVMSWLVATRFWYVGKLLFVDRDWQKSKRIASHQFLSWRRVLPSRVMCDRCLVNCEACECKYGDLRSGHLVISDEGCLDEEWELCEFGWGNVGCMELDVSSIFLSNSVLSFSSCYLITVSILLMLAVLSLSRQIS